MWGNRKTSLDASTNKKVKKMMPRMAHLKQKQKHEEMSSAGQRHASRKVFFVKFTLTVPTTERQ